MAINSARALFLMAATALAATGAQAARAADVFTLTSTTFKDGEMFAKKVGDIAARGPNCKGDNVSPQLSWSNAPDGTKSFAFAAVDPDGALGAGFVHWVAYGIPPEVTSFAEGEIGQPGDKYIGGKSGGGIAFFGGPCPPVSSPHHYLIQIIATDLDPKELPPGLTLPELQEKLKGHKKAESSLVGTYVNPYPQ